MYLLTLNDDQEIANVRAQICAPPERGFDLAGMKAALALDEVLAKAAPGEPLEIEDKDYGHLQQRIKTARWSVAAPEIIDLVERCLNAPRKTEDKAEG